MSGPHTKTIQRVAVLLEGMSDKQLAAMFAKIRGAGGGSILKGAAFKQQMAQAGAAKKFASQVKKDVPRMSRVKTLEAEVKKAQQSGNAHAEDRAKALLAIAKAKAENSRKK